MVRYQHSVNGARQIVIPTTPKALCQTNLVNLTTRAPDPFPLWPTRQSSSFARRIMPRTAITSRLRQCHRGANNATAIKKGRFTARNVKP